MCRKRNTPGRPVPGWPGRAQPASRLQYKSQQPGGGMVLILDTGSSTWTGCFATPFHGVVSLGCHQTRAGVNYPVVSLPVRHEHVSLVCF